MLSIRSVSHKLLKTRKVSNLAPFSANVLHNTASFSISNTKRQYHSYPDPNEKPRISVFKSDSKAKMSEKPKESFALASKFKLDTAFPGSPTPMGIEKTAPPTVKETKLSNGLRITSHELPGSLMVTLGFIVKCGSGYEQQSGPNSNLGATHFLELNAFRTTAARSHDEIIKELEKIGAVSQCISLRDSIFYCIDVLKENVDTALDILAEAILIPTYPEHELLETRDIVQFQSMELPSEIFSRDLVNRAAYAGYPMGNHHYCPLDKVEGINANTLQDFRGKYFFGGNCVLSVVGLEHQEVVNKVSKRFQALPGTGSTPETRPNSPTQYVGGMLTEERALKDPNFVKVCMAFEVGGWNSPYLVPMCVMQQLLGGGSSFSAGGPGKGMYTRLYTQVLNRYNWAEAVEAFTSINEDSGLLGIDTSCPPDFASNAIMMVVDQFTTLAKVPVSNEELSRAKNMLKSMMMMNLESRIMICEDIARQYSTYGHRKAPIALCDEIDKVTAEDLMKVARYMLSRPPSVSIVGENFTNLPSYDDIVKYTHAKTA